MGQRQGLLSPYPLLLDIKLLYVYIKYVGLIAELLLRVCFYFIHFKLLEFRLLFVVILCVYFYFKYFNLLKFGLSNWINIYAYFKYFMILEFFI